VADRKRFTFWIDARHDEALKAIKDRDGIPATEQLRRALDRWIEEKGVGIGKTERKRAVSGKRR
jgi:hypothetical protein